MSVLFSHVYERTGKTVRFVEFDGRIVPLAQDIQAAMYPNNFDEASWLHDYVGFVIAKTDSGWLECPAAKNLAGALKLAGRALGRRGMDPYRDPVEIEHMEQFLSGNIRKLNGDEIGATYYPDFNHTFGDRESLCILHVYRNGGEPDTGVEAIAEVEAEYSAIVESNARRDKQKTKPRERASSAKVEFTQQEVCRRAMAVHACEVEHEEAKRRLIDFASIYKAMHGISRLDFADEFYQHFSRHALRDRWAAEHELKLARKRLQTATAGYAAMIAKFGHDPFQKLYDRALELVAHDTRLPEIA
ncbi:hypothetical protein [Paraburkholderia dipogonis]|uniref:hypothetical protein n=1 Tax=Paraburkholderia dipogonis TaxID=1211383 RepID=UPI0038BB4A14